MLAAGDGLTLTLTLAVPDDYPPGSSGPIVNTADATADNAAPVQDSATVTITSEVTVGVAATKDWQPSSAPLSPGDPSTVSLSGTNSSNVPVSQLSIQEPKVAPDGAASLDQATNPFAVADFTGFANVSLPTGCTTTQVDVYVYDGSQWAWATGPPTTPGALALPSGVSGADVGGIRVTCTDAVVVNGTLSFDVDLTQKNLPVGVYSVANTAEAAVVAAQGDDPVTDDAEASYSIAPVEGGVSAAKNIEPKTIAAGESSAATISGTVTGNSTTELTLQDHDFFTADITFGGFTEGIAWPSGTTAAQVVYYDLAGEVLETVPFADGAVPTAPSGAISGFDLVFTGDIPAGQTANAGYGIDTTESATGDAADLSKLNTVTASIIDALGVTQSDSDDDTLRIVKPGIEVTLEKEVLPGDAVDPGENVVTTLQTTSHALTDTSTAHTIVVEDSAATNPSFWNAFDLDSIPSTQLPGGTSLTVEVYTGGTWTSIQVWDAQTDTTAVGLTRTEYSQALVAAGITNAGTVEGIRFTYQNDDGFPQTQTVTPALSTTARAVLRDNSGFTTEQPNVPVAYQNTATADVTGESDGGTDLEDTASGTGEGSIVAGSGNGIVDLDKQWDKAVVVAQSGDTAGTDITWSVAAYTNPVTIRDPYPSLGGPFPVANTVFDAFDLVALDRIDASNTPFSNGWYLKYDTIAEVELYNSVTEQWETVPMPTEGWIQDGAFVGYQLSEPEQLATTAFSIRLVENVGARNLAVESGTDPYAPRPYTGVAAGKNRVFSQLWQLRDTKRSDDAPVTGHINYNVAGADNAGIVRNIAGINGSTSQGVVALPADDTIAIIDGTPGVAVDKSVTATPTMPGGRVYTPADGTAAADYPTATWTVEAHNTSLSRAQQVRVTDPGTCADTDLGACQLADADADPFTAATDWLTPAAGANPFNQFDLTGLAFSATDPAEVDLDGSTVWLLRYSAGSYTTEQTTVADATAMPAEELADVVGVSVTYQGTNGSAGVGTISQTNDLTMTLSTQLRATVRSTGASTHLDAGKTVEVNNRSFAQSYDEITAEGALTGDNANAGLVLTGGDVSIVPNKAIAPDQVTPPTADSPLTVTLGAASGTDPLNTLSPSTVVIEDQADSPDFWNTFDFAGLGAVSLPAGADQVQVDVYDGADWILGTAGPTATVPVDAAQYGTIQGIRFTFSTADGGYFSTAIPSPAYSTSAAFQITIRETYRDGSGDVQYQGSVSNTQTAQALRADGNNTELSDAGATIELSEGTRELDVNKLTNDGNRFANAGDQVPFALTFTNSGTGYLTLDTLTDTLPEELLYTGESDYTATAEADGLLSGDVSLTVAEDQRTLTFGWPADGRTMNPGETFTITITAELQPGLGSAERATNTMVVSTVEHLDGCANIIPALDTTDDWAADDTTCGTTDYVQTQAGSNMYVRKGVLGSVAGAYVPGEPETVCAPSLAALDGTGYYPAPCVANSVIGGTDTWLLHAVNAGTTTINSFVIADQLPVLGDQMLIGPQDRNSTYRPQLVPDSVQVAGNGTDPTSYTVELSTSPNVCVNGWGSFRDPGTADDQICTQSGETWVNQDDFTGDWADVSGIRVIATYDAANRLSSGDGLDVTFRTTNVADDGSNGGASVTVPANDQIGYNQFGLRWTGEDTNGGQTIERRAPGKVGVHLLTASAEVSKTVAGAAADFAPDTFTAQISCTINGTTIDMGGDGTVELTRQPDGSYAPVTIRGIPYGVAPGAENADPATDGTTSCVVAEDGELGSYGETARGVDPADGTLVLAAADDPNAADPDVAAAQIATLTNTYEFGALSVTKLVGSDVEGAGDLYGPFEFELTCITWDGQPVTLGDGGATALSFTLSDGDTWNAPGGTIPDRAECTISETDSGQATDIVFAGDGVSTAADGSATVGPRPDGTAVSVTNLFDSADFTVTKQVAGEGAELYGQGEFTFGVTCSFTPEGAEGPLQVLGEDDVVLSAGQTYTSPRLPAGADCQVVETDTAGATSDELLVGGTVSDDGAFTLPGADNGEPATVAVVATNTFDVTSIEVDKTVAGDLSNPASAGPFTVQLGCLLDGTSIDIPGGADRELNQDNELTVIYQNLPVGAECSVTETDSNGADATTIGLSGGNAVAGVELAGLALAADGATVELTNTFDPTEPTGPTDTTEPSDPTEPSAPTESSDPTDPSDSTEPSAPTESSVSTEPSGTVDATGTTPPTQPTAETPDDGNLSHTGVPATTLAAFGLLFLMLGGAIVTFSRNRRPRRH